jgi:hypothetical protein
MLDPELGLTCCPGLQRIHTSRFFYPCDPPGQGICDEEGCTIPPPTAPEDPWYQCSPCGNGTCEPAFGENRCTCPADCD